MFSKIISLVVLLLSLWIGIASAESNYVEITGSLHIEEEYIPADNDYRYSDIHIVTIELRDVASGQYLRLTTDVIYANSPRGGYGDKFVFTRELLLQMCQGQICEITGTVIRDDNGDVYLDRLDTVSNQFGK